MKTIHIEAFDAESVKHAIREVKAVKYEWKRKADVCSEMIAAMLADLITENINAIPFTDDLKDIKNHVETPKESPVSAIAYGNKVMIRGEEVAFIEFGAGIYHNADSNNPLSERVAFDTAIGSYGKGQGNKKYWFVAHNLISCGTPAYMPINNAIETLKPQIPSLVRQVFL